jgi:membrane fusion protein (multidrug efflux system)
VGSLFFWISGGRVVSIDNAYVRSAKEALATDVSGIVMAVPVHEGQHVEKGEILLRLDPRPFELAVMGARANLGGIVSGLNAMKVDYKRMLRDVEVKQSQVALDQVNTDRLGSLVQSGGVTRAEFDTARFALATNKQSAEALKLSAAVQLARLGGDPEVDVQTMSDYLQAKARLDEAQRQLDHTVQSIAPNSGSEFSVLPAQNTSGNWVKVVQRIPVRITCDRKSDDPELRAGMSVIADIDTGHTRSWRDLF